MTQGIENMLNLPSMEDVIKNNSIEDKNDEVLENIEETNKDEEFINKTIEKMKNIEEKISLIKGTDHYNAMDDVYNDTLKYARELMEYGFNVDAPRARGIFEIAAEMYARAIEAKTSKRDAQLKAIKLTIDQKRLELEEKKFKNDNGDLLQNDVVIVENRNKLIENYLKTKNKKVDK